MCVCVYMCVCGEGGVGGWVGGRERKKVYQLLTVCVNLATELRYGCYGNYFQIRN